MSDKNPEELKKYLKTFDRERLVQFAANYSAEFDPADYTTGGLRDFVFEKMMEPPGEDTLEELPVEPEPVEKPTKKKKVAAPPKAAKKEKKAPAPKREKKPKKPAEPPRHFSGGKVTEKNPGVCLYVLGLARAATRAKPLTKDVAADMAVKKFPERDAARVRNKARTFPSFIKTHYRMECSQRRTESGPAYWLEPAEYARGEKLMAAKLEARKKKGEE